MTKELTLKAQARTKTGKNANRQLRAQGIVPAVFYNTTGENIPLQVNAHALMMLYGKVHRTTMFTLEVEANGTTTSHPALVWDVERYPIKEGFQHIDFYGVDINKEIKMRVLLELVGTAKGTKLGGKLEVYREYIHIMSKPGDLPNKILIDISHLDMNQGIRVADIVMPKGVRALYDQNFAILMVIAPGTDKTAEE